MGWRAWGAGAVSAACVVLVVGVAIRSGRKRAALPAVPDAAVNSPTPREPTAENLATARRLVSLADREQYVGSETCAGCHAKEAAANASRHAQTLEPVAPDREQARFNEPGRAHDPVLQADYRVSGAGGRCTLFVSSQGKTSEADAHYAFGTGNVARTYLSMDGARSRQLRLSWFPGHGWGWTPGLSPRSPAASLLGEELNPGKTVDCFSCHSTVLVGSATGLDLPSSMLGIGCETCHGPGKAHVEAVQRGDQDLQMLDLASARPGVTVHLCSACHRQPFSVDPEDPVLGPQLARFQGAALSLSKCRNVGGVTCMHCHDPHRDADELSLVEYNRTCKSCHSRGKGTEGTGGTHGAQGTVGVECPKAPRGNCVPCHMPAQTTGAFPTGRKFRNHWIKAWPDGGRSGGSALPLAPMPHD